MKATPGPWTARKEGGTWYVEVGRDQDYFDICELFGGGIKVEANAYLIAAAPELLKGLQRAEQTMRNLAANLKGDLEVIARNEAINLRDDIALVEGT